MLHYSEVTKGGKTELIVSMLRFVTVMILCGLRELYKGTVMNRQGTQMNCTFIPDVSQAQICRSTQKHKF